MASPLRWAVSREISRVGDVYWIGGATDAGKSTVANLLGERQSWAVYHYDEAELNHYSRLPDGASVYRALIDASMNERWMGEPKEMFEREIASFRERWPLVLEDLQGFGTRQVIAEGFGLLPELVWSVASRGRAVFLLPSEKFKATSFARRGKPTGRHQTRDPKRAHRNALERDRLIAREIRHQADRLGMHAVQVRVGRSANNLADLVADWFGLAT